MVQLKNVLYNKFIDSHLWFIFLHNTTSCTLLLLLLNLSQIFTMTLINNIHNKLQDNTRDWNVEQDLRPN